MSAPQRIQRKRTSGWRMPEGAIYVGRPTIFGNPFAIIPNTSREDAVLEYRFYLRGRPRLVNRIAAELRGKDLVCWCPLDQPCHADALLELANQ